MNVDFVLLGQTDESKFFTLQMNSVPRVSESVFILGSFFPKWYDCPKDNMVEVVVVLCDHKVTKEGHEILIQFEII